MRFTPVVGTLAYLWDRAADQVLLIRRTARPDDDHFGKVNGLGGKIEIDEDVVSSARREIREEAGVDATAMTLRGTITFSNFGPNREQWLVFVFLVDGWAGSTMTANAEGTLEWVDRATLLDACRGGDAAAQLPMWAGDRNFVPLVFDGDERSFHGTMPYDGDVPISWSHVRL
jgi:8-oxo-dGTP diphosphatase